MAENRIIEHRIEAGQRLAGGMPERIAQPFLEHLQRMADAETERGRKTRQAEIESSL